MIHVTKTFLPPREEVDALLDEMWATSRLTNDGPMVQRLEQELGEWLGVPHVVLVANGTLAIQLALHVLNIQHGGEVVTTPFSYVATTSALAWEGVRPVFADIDPGGCCLDPVLAEAAITSETRALLPVHVYGNPCAVDAFAELGARRGLPVIYDAAHCFGATYRGESLMAYGDLAVTSMHATKLFHTVEGGAVFCRDDETAKRLRDLRNFGHMPGGGYALEPGINAKMTEVHAAFGLAVLPHMRSLINRRKTVCEQYAEGLRDVPVVSLRWQSDMVRNYSYFPVFFDSEAQCLDVISRLEEHHIYTRRYFNPSLNTLPFTQEQHGACPVSEDICSRVLCLPVHHELESGQVEQVVRLVTEVLQKG